MLDTEILESDEFLSIKTNKLQLVCAEKIVLVLMTLYALWTIALYWNYKVIGAQVIGWEIDKYSKYAKQIENNAHKDVARVINKGLEGLEITSD